MRQVHYRRIGFNLLLAAGAALALILLTLATLAGSAEAGVTQASATPPVPSGSFIADSAPATRTNQLKTRRAPESPAWVTALTPGGVRASGADGVIVTKAVETGSGDNTIVYSGDTITYTLTVLNSGSQDLTNILVLDVLPEDTLDPVQCLSPASCYKVNEVTEIPEPLGGTLAVTVTKQISWVIPSLAPNEVAQAAFSGRVVGQPDGTSFINRAFMRYERGGLVQSTMSNEVTTTARSRITQGIGAVLAAAPSWLSKDVGGTLSLDWGDFDNDGYMDLALGSTTGTTIYRNDHGRLTLFWGNDRYTLGVRWADLNNDGYLELIAVGESTGNLATGAGTNYVYRLAGDTFEESAAFTSQYQLLRIEPGDFDKDGHLELIASTNAIDAPCPVTRYRNDNGTLKEVTGSCVSDQATAALASADINNDGYPDLVLGLFPERISLLLNVSGTLALTHTLSIKPTGAFLPYDFAWGDYDGDGYLDLAAAFPLERRVRIYHNKAGQGFELQQELRTTLFRTPLAVRWGDFNGDGRLDLAVADNPPRVYLNDNGVISPNRSMALTNGSVDGQVWAMAAADCDNDGDPDLVFGNRDGASLLFTTFAPLLSSKLTSIGSWSAGDVAWGDANGDGLLDLLFGAGPNSTGSRLYTNKLGIFTKQASFPASGFGPHSVAFGDVNGDHQLDVLLGTNGGVQLYPPNQTSLPTWTFPVVGQSIAWGDSEGDGDLDLLTAGEGRIRLILNNGGTLGSSAAWTSEEIFDQPHVAWGDYNQDGYLDFAVVSNGQPIRVYRNNMDNTFSLAWSSPFTVKGTAVAWADYDGDGDVDLTVGTNGEGTLILENVGGVFSSSRLWRSSSRYHNTSLAWGDIDNDGDLDLAVGNTGAPVQVFTNLGSKPGSPQMTWLWSSERSYESASVAWGDADGDGDLDLALAQQGSGDNGLFINNYAAPAHLTTAFNQAISLPDTPSYVHIERPGATSAADAFSSAELLSGPVYPTVTVKYKLFDPGVSRVNSGTDVPGQKVSSTLFEFSLDGGGSWKTATPLTTTLPSTVTSRLGQSATFLWNAQADQAISDDARFRITVVNQNPAGPVQRASSSAVSPPFRVRATTCLWPEAPSISMSPEHPKPGDTVRLEGDIAEGSGMMTFQWDFGDGSSAPGQVVQHVFELNHTYNVKLTVTSSPCPITRSVRATTRLVVGLDAAHVFLPLISTVSTTAASQSGAATSLSGRVHPDFTRR